ncbi:hypothetical protein HGRIS_000699 [Hohenbuehelia grisea]|uniref:Uncharacterized protein n=1 Tax=Hohenbuehelia grisea TaxID=104357 RepID=A0ABR3JRY4_9AGAR
MSARDQCFNAVRPLMNLMLDWDNEERSYRQTFREEINQLRAERETLVRQHNEQLKSQAMHYELQLENLKSAPSEQEEISRWLQEKYDALQAEYYRVEGQREVACEMEARYKTHLDKQNLALTELTKERDILRCDYDTASQELERVTSDRDSISQDRQYRLLVKLTGFDREIKSLIFTRNGRYLLSGGKDEILRVWELQSLKCVQQVRPLSGAWGSVECLTWVTADTAPNL